MRIDFDVGAFHPQRIMGVTHDLAAHPLLALEPLVALASRLAPKGAVRYHDDRAAPETNFTTAPETHKVDRPAAEVVAGIEDAHAWLALHNVQQDPEYRVLVDAILDDVQARVEARDPGTCYRAGWIFVTSPGAVTPYHMDHENNFLLQIRGTKELHAFDPLDRGVVTERCLELFHGRGSRELVTYEPGHERAATVLHLLPGQGGYMPRTAPHWVKNGPEVSITISVTYYTDETRRTKALYQANDLLRRRGLQPRAPGASAWRDGVKHRLFSAAVTARNALGRLRRRAPYRTDGRYALA